MKVVAVRETQKNLFDVYLDNQEKLVRVPSTLLAECFQPFELDILSRTNYRATKKGFIIHNDDYHDLKDACKQVTKYQR